MRRIAIGTLGLLLVMALAAAPASALPPERETFVVNNVVEDDGEACGFPVRWDIHFVSEVTRFFDEDGQLVREHAQLTEDNTVTNLATGLEVRDGPVRFIQRTLFQPDGTAIIEANGLSVNVQAETGTVRDVGRFVLASTPEGPVVLQSAGVHPARELFVDGFPAVLAAFCDVLA